MPPQYVYTIKIDTAEPYIASRSDSTWVQSCPLKLQQWDQEREQKDVQAEGEGLVSYEAAYDGIPCGVWNLDRISSWFIWHGLQQRDLLHEWNKCYRSCCCFGTRVGKSMMEVTSSY